jgi:AcrR family transcriptional regulator
MAEQSQKRRTSRDIQAEKSRKRIYEAALAIMTEKGFDETSIGDICRSAGCSVGAFYHHFPSKESILEETFRLADRDFEGWIKLSDGSLGGRELILTYMESYAELNIRSGLEFIKQFYTSKNKVFIRKGRSMQTKLIEIIAGAVERGEIRLTVTPEECCENIFVCARGVVLHWGLHEGQFDLKKKMVEMVGYILKGMEA